jgi:hypothetical protein
MEILKRNLSFFLVGLGFKLRVYYSGYFEEEVYQTTFLGWPQISVLLISASQVARITCVSLWHLASFKNRM